MKHSLQSTLILAFLVFPALAEIAPGNLDVQWNDGAANCANNAQPALQVHRYNPSTYIVRENPCVTFEAPFMYLLIGSEKALLIDSGDIADAKRAPLADTVMQLIHDHGTAKSLIVAHTHRHLDHRAGDEQFAHLANAQVIPYDLHGLRGYYKFTDQPNGVSPIDLGDRIVVAIPTPGHSETEVTFYDRNTGLVFTGDFLLPARLLVDDIHAYRASADRLVAFLKDRPVTFFLGGHIELDSQGNLFPWQAQYHPNERKLQMTREDLLALPAALADFNGFYTHSGQFTMMNSIHILIALSIVVLAALAALIWKLVHFLRRKRKKSARE